MIRHLPKSTVRKLGIFAHGEEKVVVHRDDPVFDGQFSNRCYQNAVRQAFYDFSQKAERDGRINSKPMSRLPNNGPASSCTSVCLQANACSPMCSDTTGSIRPCGKRWSQTSDTCRTARLQRQGRAGGLGKEKDAYRAKFQRRHSTPNSMPVASRRGSVQAASSVTSTRALFSWP